MSRQLLNTPLTLNTPIAITISNYGGVVELVNESTFALMINGFINDVLSPESQVGYQNAAYGGTLVVIPQSLLTISNPPATSLIVNVYDPGEVQPYSQQPLNRVMATSTLNTGGTARFDGTYTLPSAGSSFIELLGVAAGPQNIFHLEMLSITYPPAAAVTSSTLTIRDSNGAGTSLIFDIMAAPSFLLNITRNFFPGQPIFAGGFKVTVGGLTVNGNLIITGYTS